MFGFRLLLFIVAYVIVLAEMVVGSIEEPSYPTQFWIIPGGLVLVLILATSMFLLAHLKSSEDNPLPSTRQWVALFVTGMGLAAVSYYFPSQITAIMQ
ncbi:MAG: hypothetical protein AAF608_02465 [Pseudomonadota bacterium]